MNDEYPLYPELTEDGKKEAQLCVNKFKELFLKAADECMGDIYTDVITHIESDSWTNYRNFLMQGLTDYSNKEKHGKYDFKRIRRAIYDEFRDEIIHDLNQDMLKKIEDMEGQIEFMRKLR